MIRWISIHLARPLSLFLGIYMVNLSIDAAADLEGSPFDPTVNEIESIVELVMEVVMEKSDAFPEQEEPDPESGTCLTLLDHMIPTTGLFDLESTHIRTLTNPPILTSMNYRDPALAYHLPPPRNC